MSQRRQSLIVNNFFTLVSILLISITIVLYSKYISNDDYKNDNLKEKVIPLPCEKETFSTSKVFNQKLLNDSIKALNKGHYKLEGGYTKSVYLESMIEDFIKIDSGNYGAINLNNMIPVPEGKYEEININEEKDNFYKILLQNQLTWCNKNKEIIIKKAENLRNKKSRF